MLTHIGRPIYNFGVTCRVGDILVALYWQRLVVNITRLREEVNSKPESGTGVPRGTGVRPGITRSVRVPGCPALKTSGDRRTAGTFLASYGPTRSGITQATGKLHL